MGLKGITIETPPQEEAHIYAADDRAIWEAILGVDGVVDVGQKLKGTLISNNQLRIYDGALVVGGAIGRIPFGEYEDIVINNGTQNQRRNDLVVAQIEANGAIENMKLQYIKGTPGATAADPDYTKGNVYGGATLRQYPLYRIKLNGLNVEAVEPMFEVVPNLVGMKTAVSELNSNLNMSARNTTVSGWNFRRRGNIVAFTHNKTIGGVVANYVYTNQGSPPVGYRPDAQLFIEGSRVIGSSLVGRFYLTFNNNGSVAFVSDQGHSSEQSYVASGCYMTNDHFPESDKL